MLLAMLLETLSVMLLAMLSVMLLAMLSAMLSVKLLGTCVYACDAALVLVVP